MRSGIALAAAACLFAAPATAASRIQQPLVTASITSISAARPVGRRLGQSVWHAKLTGSYSDLDSGFHQLVGEGDFFPTFGPSSTQLRFSVQLTDLGGNGINFGTLEGDGITEGGGSADQARFDVNGVLNENNYRLYVTGSFGSGHIYGTFSLVGAYGIGVGTFAGPH